MSAKHYQVLIIYIYTAFMDGNHVRSIDWNICPLVLGMAKGYIALEGWPRAI
jgi:hypothetical protein